MAARHNFRKSTIWKDNISIVKNTYAIPKPEIYALYEQMQRCSVSILLNITEGTSKETDKHFTQYLETALGSAFELETQLIISFEIGYISEDTFKHLENKIQMIQGMITRLMENLQKS